MPRIIHHQTPLSRRAASIIACAILAIAAGYITVTTHAAGTINGHTVVTDGSGKLLSWYAPQADSYDHAVNLAWSYLFTGVPLVSGKPAYYSQSYMDPDTNQPAGWPHNPAGLYSMLTESAIKYYPYSGDARATQLAIDTATWHLDHGLTPASYNWDAVPYSSGDAGSLTYDGADYGNSTGVGDGNGYLEPDKIGELGFAFLQIYEYTGNTRFRDAAIHSADVLSAHVRTGSASQSPWPFRVNAQSGAVREQYCADTIGPIRLLDELIRLGLGSTTTYQSTRTTAWNWLMTYPMTNNVWTQYFEDVGVQSDYSGNRNQYDAMMTARYLLEHPEFDANWESHVRGLIAWVEQNFNQLDNGANTIREQNAFMHPMGSHTSRYASINALLYEKTGDTAAKEKAYRSYNWATYMARTNGHVIDGPEVNNMWFTDGYGDYIRHFMTGMGAVPEWSPAAQNHLLRSSSVIKSATYSAASIAYTTFDSSSTEVFHLTAAPAGVSLGATPLSQRSDLSAPGWTYSANVLRVYHTGGTSLTVTLAGGAVNQPPTATLTAPAAGAQFTAPAAISLTASAADSDGTVAKVDFYNGAALLGTDATSPYAYSWTGVPAGAYTLTAVATDNSGATGTSSPVGITVTAAADTTPPVISAVTTTGANQNGATITWTTNEPSDSKVEYGPTTAYGSATALNSSLVTSHTMVVAGLDAGTTYHYRVLSRDNAGNLATSPDFTFATQAASLIGDLNSDGAVNIFDLSTLLSRWATADTTADINHDGSVNIFDLSALLSHWTG